MEPIQITPTNFSWKALRRLLGLNAENVSTGIKVALKFGFVQDKFDTWRIYWGLWKTYRLKDCSPVFVKVVSTPYDMRYWEMISWLQDEGLEPANCHDLMGLIASGFPNVNLVEQQQSAYYLDVPGRIVLHDEIPSSEILRLVIAKDGRIGLVSDMVMYRNFPPSCKILARINKTKNP